MTLDEILKALPEGWTCEPGDVSGYFIVFSPSRFMTTIDVKRRGFRSGIVHAGRMTSTVKYTGRAWKTRLLADVVAHLSRIEPP